MVEESADGVVWSPVRTITNKNNTDEAYTDTLLAASRFVAFTYQTKVSGNLQFDMLTVAAAPNGWQAWLTSSGLSGDAAGRLSDPDRDGLANCVEYVLGSGPLSGLHTALPTASVAGTDFEFKFPRTDQSESDSLLVVEWSNDLVVWNPIAVGATTAGIVQVEERGAEADLVTVRIPLTNAPDGRMLARLKVVIP